MEINFQFDITNPDEYDFNIAFARRWGVPPVSTLQFSGKLTCSASKPPQNQERMSVSRYTVPLSMLEILGLALRPHV